MIGFYKKSRSIVRDFQLFIIDVECAARRPARRPRGEQLVTGIIYDKRQKLVPRPIYTDGDTNDGGGAPVVSEFVDGTEYELGRINGFRLLGVGSDD